MTISSGHKNATRKYGPTLIQIPCVGVRIAFIRKANASDTQRYKAKGFGRVMTLPYSMERMIYGSANDTYAKQPRRVRRGCSFARIYLLISKFWFMISLMALSSSVMLASPWMVCLMTEEATAKLIMSMGL